MKSHYVQTKSNISMFMITRSLFKKIFFYNGGLTRFDNDQWNWIIHCIVALNFGLKYELWPIWQLWHIGQVRGIPMIEQKGVRMMNHHRYPNPKNKSIRRRLNFMMWIVRTSHRNRLFPYADRTVRLIIANTMNNRRFDYLEVFRRF